MENIFKRDKDMILELANRNIKKQYRGSVLGFVWTILNPLLTMLVMWFVFSSIFGKSAYYPLYLLCGNIMFSALKAATTRALTDIQGNRNLLLRTQVHPYVFPCSTTIASLINFALSLIALIPFMIWLSVSGGLNLFTYRLVFILLMLPAFWLFEYGLGLLLSVLYVFFRDIKNIYQVIILLWQYLTPIFYTVDRFSGEGASQAAKIALKVINLNPMFHFTNYLRECVYMGVAGIDPMFPNDTGAIAQYFPRFWPTLCILYLSGIVMAGIGIITYKALKHKLIVRL